MSHGLAELTAHAKDLVGAGDLGSAQMLLSDALAAVDVDPLRASADLADAAGLLARILVALGEPHSARAWATFAHTAQRRLRGPADERTVVAAATLAAVLHRVGAFAGAAHLYRDVVARLTLVDGPGSMRVLAAQADLATVEHARGECDTARRLLVDAYRRHRETYGEGHPAGIKMLARLGTMERDCGNFGEAHQRFAGARDLCRDYLPAGHPMAAQIAALAHAGADPEHVCHNSSPADDDFSADPLPNPPTPDLAGTPGSSFSPAVPTDPTVAAGTPDAPDTAEPDGGPQPAFAPGDTETAGAPESHDDAAPTPRTVDAAEDGGSFLPAPHDSPAPHGSEASSPLPSEASLPAPYGSGDAAPAAEGAGRAPASTGSPWGTAPQRAPKVSPWASEPQPAANLTPETPEPRAARTPEPRAEQATEPQAGQATEPRVERATEIPEPDAGFDDFPPDVDDLSALQNLEWEPSPAPAAPGVPDPIAAQALTHEPDIAHEPDITVEPDIAHEPHLADNPDITNNPDIAVEPGAARKPDPAGEHDPAGKHDPAGRHDPAGEQDRQEPEAAAPAASEATPIPHDGSGEAGESLPGPGPAPIGVDDVAPSTHDETPHQDTPEADAGADPVPAAPPTAEAQVPAGEPEFSGVPWQDLDSGWHTPLVDRDPESWRPPVQDPGSSILAAEHDPVVGPWHPPLQSGEGVEPWRAVSFYAGHELRNRAAAADKNTWTPDGEPAPGAWAQQGPEQWPAQADPEQWPAQPDPGQWPAQPDPERWEPPSPSTPWRPSTPWETQTTGPSAAPEAASRSEPWQPPAAPGPSEPWPRGAQHDDESGATPWTPPAQAAPGRATSGIPRSTPWATEDPVDAEPDPAFGDWPLDEPPAWQPPEAAGAWSSAPPPAAPEEQAVVPPQGRPGRYATPPTPMSSYDEHERGQAHRPAEDQWWADEGTAAPLPPAVFDDPDAGPPEPPAAGTPAVVPPRHPVPADPAPGSVPGGAPSDAAGSPPEQRGYAQRQAQQEQPWRTQARGVRTPPPGGRYSPLAPGYGQPGQPQIKAHRRTQGDRSLTAGPAPVQQQPGMLVPTRRPVGPAPERYPERPIGKILAAMIVVGLGTVVVIGGFLLTERDTEQTPPPQAPATSVQDTATPPPAEAPARPAGGPPTGLRIEDGRTQVTLTWAYPENAEGPVVLNGGRKGQTPQLITELPAGTERFSLNLNNPDADYCFTAAVVYSTTSVQKSAEVCTTR
ncbi:tetratricopeptide repeat protein [Catenuloplanes japonicus]|uniref:tetratricopeptide repeat protein n=1 Tax=Catenuloplanes japonicus TaxID=33876 RepID=UPI001E5A4A59|nr:tetratricopeptide repeat protein [Catenuloplanes japonicus]